uniref:Uncharacterized protein n=1 Tax=Rhizophora mucronata TaxID=61149 RepID=A0A2P2JFE7_RHIMU
MTIYINQGPFLFTLRNARINTNVPLFILYINKFLY